MEAVNEFPTEHKPTANVSTGMKMDLADLVSLLLAATQPDRDLDLLVAAMLGGKAVAWEINATQVRAGFWLRNEIPKYTHGEEALYALAHRRGLRVDIKLVDGIWQVKVLNPVTSDSITIKHSLQGVAGVAGIAAIVSRESEKS